jgi:hypothetical protein
VESTFFGYLLYLGTVRKALWDGTTHVALKKLHDMSEFDQFVKEASLLQTLLHPNILRL